MFGKDAETHSKWCSKHNKSSISRTEMFQLKNKGMESHKSCTWKADWWRSKFLSDYKDISLIEGR